MARAAAAFVLGTLLGAWANAPMQPSYILVLSGESDPKVTPQEETECVREYARWASELRDSGVAISGARLVDGPRLFQNGSSEPSGVQSYFLFDVSSDERAIEIAESCPHLRYGGAVTLGHVARLAVRVPLGLDAVRRKAPTGQIYRASACIQEAGA